MKTLKIGALLSFAIAVSIVIYYFTIGDKPTKPFEIQEIITQNNNEKEYNKFITETKEMIAKKSFPMALNDEIDIDNIGIKGYSLVYYLSAEESYRPGEENGISKRLALSALEDVIRANFCSRSYFKKLPLSVEFRYSTKDTQYNPDEYPPLLLKTQKVCKNEIN